MTKRKKNNIIIGSLLAVVLLMAVGYAAFSSVLNISGTGSITSSWNIKITNVEVSNTVGDASDGEGTTFEDLTATINSNLVSPGDSITYDVTVRNDGNLDAVLTNINLSESTNPAISFSTSNLEAGDELQTGEEAILKVTITYNNVTSQPENTSASLNVTLTYEQKGSGTITPGGDSTTIGGQDVELVTTGDGLYEDSTRAGRYVYKGADPDNYIEFNDELWRIVAKETDGTYKIVRNELLSEQMPFDEQGYRDSDSGGAGGTYCANSFYGCNAWAATTNLIGQPAEFTNTTQTGTVLLDSTLNTYLNGTYYNSLSATARNQIVSHEWGVGATYTEASWNDDGDEDPSEFVEEENEFKWNGKVGLLSSSDVHLSVSNEELCGTDNKYYDNLETCAANNWVVNGQIYWLLSPGCYSSSGVNQVRNDGSIGDISSAYYDNGVRPAIYLSSNLTLTGSGTMEDPYVPTN